MLTSTRKKTGSDAALSQGAFSVFGGHLNIGAVIIRMTRARAFCVYYTIRY